MADKPLRLKLYQGADGAIACDATGRTWRTREQGGKVIPIGLDRPFAFVDRFAEPKSK